MCTRWGGFLEDVARFDAEFFGITPREAERIDPQQRLVLEVAWEALEDAGIAPDQLAGSRTGVFVGISHCDYDRIISRDLARLNIYNGAGSYTSIAANRVSYVLRLRGPSMTIDTACSSSSDCGPHCLPVAPWRGDVAGPGRRREPDPDAARINRHQQSTDVCRRRPLQDVRRSGRRLRARRGLRHGRTQAPARRSPRRRHRPRRHSRLGCQSERPQQRPHGAQRLRPAGGHPPGLPTLQSNRCGSAISRRMASAPRLAIRSRRRPSQQCWRRVGRQVSLASSARPRRTSATWKRPEVSPGSSKSFSACNTGRSCHTFICGNSAPMSRSTRRYSPSRPLAAPGPTRQAGASPGSARLVLAAVIVTSSLKRPKCRSGLPRLRSVPFISLRLRPRANKHCEHWPSDTRLISLRPRRPPWRTRALPPTPDGRSSTTVLPPWQKRLLLCGEQLDQYGTAGHAVGIASGRVIGRKPPKVAFLFPGLASQQLAVGRQVYQTQPTFRRALDRCSALLGRYLPRPLLPIFDPPPGEGSPPDQAAAECALFALEFALAAPWRSWGVEPTAILGQGPGECVAACVVGQFCLEEGLKLLALRADDAQGPPRDATVAAVYGPKPPNGAQPLCARLPLADGVRYLREQKCEVFLELGPGETLCAGKPVPARADGTLATVISRRAGRMAATPGDRWVASRAGSQGRLACIRPRLPAAQATATDLPVSGPAAPVPTIRIPAAAIRRVLTLERGPAPTSEERAHHDLPACTRWCTIGTSQPRLRRPFLGDRAALMAFSTTAESELVARPKTGAADAKRGVSIAQ